MKRVSECVSLGHPDKVADYISSYLLDRYLERDPKTRYAVEVQMKDNYVTLGGEVTSKARFTKAERADFVRQAVAAVGYTADYAKRWGTENVPNADALTVAEHLSEQSPDIAQGVDAGGWGDQGIYWGMATPDEDCRFMPRDHFIARKLCAYVYEELTQTVGCGLDVKTLVEESNFAISKVVVAAPCLDDRAHDLLVDAVKKWMVGDGHADAALIVNGTGRFVTHGPVGDCGTTGRKLAADFYGGNCRIGGGSPWTKDGTKADVALNLYARQIALQQMRLRDEPVYVAIASVIGRPEISVQVLDRHNYTIDEWEECRPAHEIIDQLHLREPIYARMCRYGLFHDEVAR